MKKRQGTTNSDAAQAIARACAGLVYTSETDAAWRIVRWPAAEGEPNAGEVKRRIRIPAASPAAQVSVDAFFAPLTEYRDWFRDEERAVAEQYRSLSAVLKQALRRVQVFRLGERDLIIVIVGQDKAGGWTGIKTRAVET